MPHNSPDFGSHAKPIVFRSPLAKIVLLLPSGVDRNKAACSGLVSLHALQDEPTLM